MDGREASDADRAARAANRAETEASNALIAIAPTTLAGMRAAIAWFVQYDDGCIPETSGRFLAILVQVAGLLDDGARR